MNKIHPGFALLLVGTGGNYDYIGITYVFVFSSIYFYRPYKRHSVV
jgi:hypothetical protein